MVWNVYREDFNRGAIIKYNIFDHGGFAQDVNKLLKEDISKDGFAERLKRSLMHWFWCKSEHEVVISSWPVYIDKAELDRIKIEYEDHNNKWGHYLHKINVAPDVDKKVDICSQVMMNWDQFVEYIWSNKNNQSNMTD